MPKPKDISKQPPKKTIKTVQMDLFSEFISNDANHVSNSVELWESIPKYFFTPRQIKKLRTPDGLAKPYKWDYSHNGVPYSVKIQPALIEQKDGTFKAFFPGVTEELVEEALKKILSNQQYALHDPKNIETWVRFTLSMVQKELQARNKTRNRSEIKHAIEVMSSCVLTFYSEKKEVWKGSILQDLVTVGRDEYLADIDAHHVCRLPLFISRAINHLEYRQFNYERLMGCKEQLSRWIYKRLINRFKQASIMNDYHFMYSNIKLSGLLQQERESDNRKKVSSALEELKIRQVLVGFKMDERKEGRKTVDVKYTVYPSPDFVREQKAANKRQSDANQKALKAGLI
ncbi:MAG: hypothetical protein ACQ9MH_15310 [Nitrospinales bacterium]